MRWAPLTWKGRLMAVSVMWRGTTPHGEDWVLVRRDDGFALRHGPDEMHIPDSGADRISVTRRLSLIHI